MRTVLSFVFAVLFLTAFAQAVFAQRFSEGGPGPAIQEGDGKKIAPEQFSEMKGRVLTMIEERRARLDQEKACVEAATDAAALRKCRPERPMGPGGRPQRGPGQQQPPLSGMDGQR
jgi:hypothetical protein